MPPRWPAYVAVLVALASLALVCASASRTRSAIARARAACAGIAAGTSVADARRALVDGEGAGPIGSPSAFAPSTELLGVVGSLVGWNCQLQLDPAGRLVRATWFSAWIVPHTRASWDPELSFWIESHLL